jgi:ribonuclease D
MTFKPPPKNGGFFVLDFKRRMAAGYGMQTPQLITTTADLRIFCESLTHPYVTLDTEFVRERTYYPELCLVQLATPTQLALVDTLAEGLDLAPLFELLARKTIVKVLHSGRQDIEIFWHLGKCIPTPLFDTQIAAMALGLGDNLSYSSMVKHYTGETLDKSQQYTNWSRRPLSPSQLEYASADVTLLCGIYEKMVEDLAAAGRTHWIEELHTWLSDPAIYETKPEDAWKRLKQDKMPPRGIAALQHLAAWREEQAIKRDLTRRFIMPDEALQAIATHLPKDADALAQLRAAKSISPMAREASLAAIHHARTLPENALPHPEKKSRVQVSAALAQLLSMLLKARAEEAKVAAELIATRDELESFLKGEPSDITRGWRFEVFGTYAEQLLAGTLALRVENGRIVFEAR